MPVEIEAKLKVEDLDEIRSRLKGIGAQPAGSVLETNTFFDTPGRALLAADQGLRLRQQRDLTTGQQQLILTFKGPRRAGELKSREEIELHIDDGAAAASLLSHLGYKTVLSFEKRRESWLLGGCQVELDELPHLGTFVEIEGPSESAIEAVRRQLVLADRPLVQETYIAMLVAYLESHGLPKSAVRFTL